MKCEHPTTGPKFSADDSLEFLQLRPHGSHYALFCGRCKARAEVSEKIGKKWIDAISTKDEGLIAVARDEARALLDRWGGMKP